MDFVSPAGGRIAASFEQEGETDTEHKVGLSGDAQLNPAQTTGERFPSPHALQSVSTCPGIPLVARRRQRARGLQLVASAAGVDDVRRAAEVAADSAPSPGIWNDTYILSTRRERHLQTPQPTSHLPRFPTGPSPRVAAPTSHLLTWATEQQCLDSITQGIKAPWDLNVTQEETD